MATIKLNHIEFLVGALNYDTWKHGVSQVFQGEGYWGHVKGDPNLFSVFPIEPAPAVPTVISTAAEITEYCKWWKANSKAHTIIER
jgi:hypothetical protein